MANYSIGVDLGGTNLRIAVVDETGSLLEKVTLDTKVKLGRDHVVRDMCGAVQQMVGKHRNSGSLQGIGIGVPGIIDMRTGMVHESPNLPDWTDYPVRTEIEKQLGTRVVLENDANSAALGEKWLGAAREMNDMAMLTLGTGVGGGLVLDGRVWHGMIGMAAEFGHTTVEPEGALCGCGNHGCLEAYASATAVVRMAKEAVANGGPTGLSKIQDLSAKAVFDLAQKGDPAAKKVYATVGRALGIVLSGMVNALNLPMYVIGGGVSAAWDVFAPAMFQELRSRSMVFKATDPDRGVGNGNPGQATTKTIITRARLGSDAGLFGAARLPQVNGH